VREQEISAAVKNPRKIELENESSPSKLRAGSIFKTNEKITRLQEGKNPVPVFQRMGSLQESPEKTRMTPKYRARKIPKIDDANYKIDTTRIKRRCSKRWKHRGGTHTMQTQTERRKEC
jgi:hypothetical protein